MFDFSAMYDEVYAVIGVPATLSAGTAGEVSLTVIDDTRPKTTASGAVEVRSVGPGAFARIPELAENGIARDDYMDAVLAFNGRTWVVRSYELRGSPNGEDVGEVRFLLKMITTPTSSAPASIAYQTSATQGGGGPYSIALTVASAAGQDRLVSLMGISSAITTTTFSVTIDGQAATQVGSYVRAPEATGASSGIVQSFWRAAGTSNTSINVACAVSGTMFDIRCSLWTLSNASVVLDTSSAFSGGTTGTDLSLSIDTAAAGVLAAVAMGYDAQPSLAITWSGGLTERFEGATLYSIDVCSAADLTTASASTPLNVAVDFTDIVTSGSNSYAALAVSFGPAGGVGDD